MVLWAIFRKILVFRDDFKLLIRSDMKIVEKVVFLYFVNYNYNRILCI